MRDYSIKYNLKCKYCGLERFTNKSTMSSHEKHCVKNENAIPWKSHKLSEETRKKVSEGMKKAIKEGRATGWHKRKAGTKSYPEMWMETVIKSEFTDKNYISELHVGKYRLDFAWPEKMIYIEIDGQQHERRKEKDIEKDNFCKALGWTVLRMTWSYISSNKELAIKQMKDFVDNGVVSNIKWKSKAEIKKEFENVHISSGCLKDINGHWSPNKLSDNIWEDRKQKILECGVDLTHYGWLEKVCKITGLTRKQVNLTVSRFNIEVYRRACVVQVAECRSSKSEV